MAPYSSQKCLGVREKQSLVLVLYDLPPAIPFGQPSFRLLKP
jgi:hypothetical protein